MVVVVFVSLLFMSASIPADLVYTEDVLGVENVGIGVVFSAWTLGMLVGSNVLARRVALGGLVTAALVGVVVQGLGKFVAPFWLVFAFMVAMYFVGGIGHGLKNVASRTLDPRPDSRPSATGGHSPHGTVSATAPSSARSPSAGSSSARSARARRCGWPAASPL